MTDSSLFETKTIDSHSNRLTEKPWKMMIALRDFNISASVNSAGNLNLVFAAGTKVWVCLGLDGTTNVSIAWNTEGENEWESSGCGESDFGLELVVHFGEVEVLAFTEFAGSFPGN